MLGHVNGKPYKKDFSWKKKTFGFEPMTVAKTFCEVVKVAKVALTAMEVGDSTELSESSCLLSDCPPDLQLYDRVVATTDSEKFLTWRKEFPFKEAAEPSSCGEVTNHMVVEEPSEIDDESYLVISKEHLVDGMSHFMAEWILSNPDAQNMTLEELQKTLAKAFDYYDFIMFLLQLWQKHSTMV